MTSHSSAAIEFVIAPSAAASPVGPGTGTVSSPQPHTAEYCSSWLMVMLPAAAAAARPCEAAPEAEIHGKVRGRQPLTRKQYVKGVVCVATDAKTQGKIRGRQPPRGGIHSMKEKWRRAAAAAARPRTSAAPDSRYQATASRGAGVQAIWAGKHSK